MASRAEIVAFHPPATVQQRGLGQDDKLVTKLFFCIFSRVYDIGRSPRKKVCHMMQVNGGSCRNKKGPFRGLLLCCGRETD